jgi:hypothetical protein
MFAHCHVGPDTALAICHGLGMVVTTSKSGLLQMWKLPPIDLANNQPLLQELAPLSTKHVPFLDTGQHSVTSIAFTRDCTALLVVPNCSARKMPWGVGLVDVCKRRVHSMLINSVYLIEHGCAIGGRVQTSPHQIHVTMKHYARRWAVHVFQRHKPATYCPSMIVFQNGMHPNHLSRTRASVLLPNFGQLTKFATYIRIQQSASESLLWSRPLSCLRSRWMLACTS